MHLQKKKKKKKKWDRFDLGPFWPSFLGCGAVLTNLWGRFDQMGAVLTWGRFDCNSPAQSEETALSKS